MKLNFKKLKLNQMILIVAIITVVGWMLMKSSRIEKLEGDPTTDSDIVLYVKNREVPNPFIVYGMAKEMTEDDAILEKILALAAEANKPELLEVVKNL
jgi:Tfp pilus assembly protein PilO